MAFWIELHCDARSAGADACGVPKCITQRGDTLGHMTRDASGAYRTTARLSAEARKNGWRKTRRGWQCPSCREVLAEAKAPTGETK